MATVGVTIHGIPEAQAELVRQARELRPSGALGKAIKEATLHLHQYAVQITHVDTGALRASHVPEVRGAMGRIYPNPAATRSDGKKPAHYGIYEHRRGGAHAFYARTVAEAGRGAHGVAFKVIERALG